MRGEEGHAAEGALRILLVDDNPVDRGVARALLRRDLPGVQVQEVERAEEWEQVRRAGRFDLAVLDSRLGWAEGRTLLHLLKAERPDTPVLMLTGIDDAATAVQLVREGLDEYLTKTPEGYRFLSRSVRFALERSRQRRALRQAHEAQERLLASLEAERRQLAAVLDSLPLGVVIVEAAPGRGVRTNQRAEELLGGKEGAAQRLASWLERERSGEPLPVEALPLVRALEGETVHGQVVASPLADAGQGFLSLSAAPVRSAREEVVAAVLVLDDVTARIRTQEELRRTGEFRESFLGMVGHDLRSPLQALLLGAQMLARETALPGHAARTAGRMVLNAERMARMISDLLDFTRGRLGSGIPVLPESLALETLVREVAEDQQLAHPGSRVEVQVEGDTRGRWDPDRLAQLLANLVGNALRHGEAGRPVRVVVRGRREQVEVAVHNEGPPIPPTLLPLLFEPFRQGERRERMDGGGLGLGLYIVHQIARAHGGEVTASSSPGEGTTFCVRLPRQCPSRG